MSRRIAILALTLSLPWSAVAVVPIPNIVSLGAFAKAAGEITHDFVCCTAGNLWTLLGAFDRDASAEPLTTEDAKLEPTPPPAGSPQLPSACMGTEVGPGVRDVTTTQKCEQCGFERAHEDLARNRQRFEKLRRVGAATRSYAAGRMAFGDSVAGSLGVGGLAWTKQRVGIEQSLKQFDGQYDKKHLELSTDLEGVLRRIAVCEEQVFGEKDWYDRYGFIYYQFVTTAHKR